MLTTKYQQNLTDMPHNYYPRPQMKRDSFLCLNGWWDFNVTENAQKPTFDSQILVPFPPESSASGINRIIGKAEYMHYRRKFTLPKEFIKDRVLLHFGAVDSRCEVYINEKLVGKNTGGYVPFFFDITEFLHDGENDLYVLATDGIDKSLPYGKQTYKRGGMWYTPVSGIWQTVWMESVPESYIRSLRITPTKESVTVSVEGGTGRKSLKLENGEVYEFSGDSITVSPESPHPWCPEDPFLYRFELCCGEDKVESYFALREVGVKLINGKKRLTLNGEPYLFNGLLDQGYYPDGIFLPSTLDGIKDDILLTKKLGFNMLRKHIKIEPMIYYYLCDVEGVAVFQDMLNNSDYSFFRDTVLPTVGFQKLSDKRMHSDKNERAIFQEQMLKTAEHLYNCPCIVYYTIFNEGWGQFNSDAMYKILKEKDPTRIIDSTSGWFRQKLSDVDSRHVYFKALKIKGRTQEPLVISEFGGYSHRVDGHLFGEKNYGYRLFTDKSEFEKAFVKLYETEVIPLVLEGCDALVYTQLSDVEDETNGLVTYDRDVVKINECLSKNTMDKVWQSHKKSI